MTLEDKAAVLVRYIRLLIRKGQFEMHPPSGYRHMGATIVDAILQAGINYESVVRRRAERLLKEYPQARKTSGFLRLLQINDLKRLLAPWDGDQKPNRIVAVLRFFHQERIETERDLRRWLGNEVNVSRLKGIKGVKDKTANYFKILAGISTVAIDRHLRKFLNEAGIEVCDDEEAEKVICAAARHVGKSASTLDHSIWKYMSDGRGCECKPCC
jgi:hypothetical protein